MTMGLISLSQIIFWFFIPESPRWLLAKNKLKEAEKVLQKAAKINKRELSVGLFDSGPAEGQDTVDDVDVDDGVVELFKGPTKINTYALLIVWPVVALGYYGVALSMSSIGGDVFTNNPFDILSPQASVTQFQRAASRKTTENKWF